MSEWLVDHANDWSASNSDTYHVRHVLYITRCEGFGAINRINPDCNITGFYFFCECASSQIDRGSVFFNDLCKPLLVVRCLVRASHSILL